VKDASKILIFTINYQKTGIRKLIVLIKDESHNEKFKSEKQNWSSENCSPKSSENSKNQIRKQYQNAETKFDQQTRQKEKQNK
jgi:hypothetical protein